MFWTGCPNSCGQVQVADVGLMGAMVRNAPGAAPAMVPGVDVFVGGRAGADSHLAAVTHPSVRLADLHPLLETILVESFGATRRAAPLPNPGHASRFRLASAPAPPGGAKPAPPKGTPRKAGNATHICTACGYIYTSVDPPFAATPAEYECPQCGAPRSAFKPLATDQDPSAGAGAGGGPVALRGPGVAVRLTLVEREELSGDTRRLRFSFADPLATLGLPVGNHLALALPGGGPGGGALRRAYTPVSPPDAVGFVDLVVKVYLPCARFPEGGAMTRVLEALRPGDGVDADGPAGRVAYAGRGGLAVADAATGAPGLRRAAALALVAGGSGLTPCLALIRAVFSDPADTTRVALLYANQTPADVLLRAELEAIAAAHPNFRRARAAAAAGVRELLSHPAVRPHPIRLLSCSPLLQRDLHRGPGARRRGMAARHRLRHAGAHGGGPARARRRHPVPGLRPARHGQRSGAARAAGHGRGFGPLRHILIPGC